MENLHAHKPPHTFRFPTHQVFCDQTLDVDILLPYFAQIPNLPEVPGCEASKKGITNINSPSHECIKTKTPFYFQRPYFIRYISKSTAMAVPSPLLTLGTPFVTILLT
jgi:hypothetical protein